MGIILPPLVRIGLTDLPNIAGASCSLPPPPPSGITAFAIAWLVQFVYAVQNNNSIEFGSQSNSKYQQNMFVLLFLSLFPANSLSQSNPKVCLDSICFKGSWITTSKGIKFASFQGIKYGQVPNGKLRFKPPQASKYFFKDTHVLFIGYSGD